MEISRKAAAVLTFMALAAAACNSASEPTGGPVATEAPPTTAVTTTTAAAANEADTMTAEAEQSGDESEVLLAYRTVFDSRIPFEEKLPYLENAGELREVVEEYAETAENFGGISLDPTAVEIDGDLAEVTYNVMFGERAVYTDLTGNAVRVDGAWTVTRERFCTFMSSARVSCPTS